MSTPEAELMAAIVAAAAPSMKSEGFRKRRHSFNRQTPSGLVHVVNFWQHPKEPPAWTEAPGLRERGYGTFRLDFGVYVPEMTRSGSPRSAWINEYNCHLRSTIGQLMEAPGDLWWPLDRPMISDVGLTALVDIGLPWLSQFSTHDDVHSAFKAKGAAGVGMSPAGGLDIADMLTALGREGDARAELEAYVARQHLASHAAYLRDYLTRIGHADLVDRIAVVSPDRERTSDLPH